MGAPVGGSPAATGQRVIPEVNALREWEASAAIQKFYAERAETTTKKKAANRSEAETIAQNKAAAPAGSNPWERVADLIDTSARAGDDSRDTSRMRALLIQLKTNPVVSVA